MAGTLVCPRCGALSGRRAVACAYAQALLQTLRCAGLALEGSRTAPAVAPGSRPRPV